MNSDILNNVRQELVSEAERLRGDLADMETKVSAIRSELKRVESTISTIDRKPSGNGSIAGVSSEDVHSAVTAVLAEAKTGLNKDKLKAQVGDVLRAKGRSLRGFPQAFSKVLKSDDFIVNERGEASLRTEGQVPPTKQDAT